MDFERGQKSVFLCECTHILNEAKIMTIIQNGATNQYNSIPNTSIIKYVNNTDFVHFWQTFVASDRQKFVDLQ